MKTILFLCRHNKSRSQYAEAYFNHINTNPDLHAVSAGTAPMEEINPVIREVLDEKGIESSRLKPKKLTPAMLNDDTTVITMGCNVDCGIFDFPVTITEDWALEDPHEQSKETTLEICGQIEQLVQNLQNRIAQ